MKQNCRTGMVGAGVGRALDVRALVKVLAISVLMMCATLFGAFGPAQAWAEDVAQPSHTKTLVANDDGSYTVSLDVAGEVQRDDTQTPVDVVIVLDKSGSMAYAPGRDENPGRWEDSRWDIATDAVDQLVRTLLTSENAQLDESEQVRVALVSFSDTASTSRFSGGNWTTNAGQVHSAMSQMNVSGGTNWEDALDKANNLSTGREGAQKYIIFLSDGDPTYRTSSARCTGWYTEYTSRWPYQQEGYANNELNADDAYDTPPGVHGSGRDDPFDHNYDFAVESAGERGGATLFVIDSAARQSLMDDFSDEANGRYFEGRDEEQLQSAFEAIADVITHSTAFGQVSITDTLSKWAEFASVDGGEVSAASEPTFSYQISTDGGESFSAWHDAPAATYDAENGQIAWDLSSLPVLEDGTVYRVSFTIRPTQASFDDAASDSSHQTDKSVLQDGATPADNSGNRVIADEQLTGYFSNGTAQVHYSTASKDSDDADWTYSQQYDADYNKPVMQVPTSTLKISKVWTDGNDNHADDSVKVQILQDNESYKQVELNANKNWTADVTVSAGWTGHTYTVSEEGVSGDYTVTIDPVEGVRLKGHTAQQKSFTITNSPATGNLSITKKVDVVEGLTAPEDATFDFEVTIADAANKPYAVEGYGDIPEVTFDGDGKLQLNDVKANQTVTIKGLPKDAAYRVVELESGMPAGFEQTAIVDSDDPTNDGVGTLAAGETDVVTVTNTYQGVGLKIFKYTTDDGTKAPLPNAEFTVTNDSGYSKTVKTGDDGYASFTGLGDGVYTISETKVPAGFSKAPDRTLTITGDTAKLAYKDSGEQIGDPIKLAGGVFSISIENTGVSSLPTTGGSGSIVIPAMGVSMVAVAGWYLARKAKITR